jgi:hypothetical protein
MASLPNATTTISTEAGPPAAGSNYCVVIGCVATNADTTVRVFNSTKALYAQHGYAPAVDYAALHIEATKKPVIFIGIPVVTAGVVGQNDASGVTGTSVITVTGTPLEAVDATFTVTTGGTVGTTGIKGTLSLDGGITSKVISLGTNSTYAIPYVGLTLNFAAGTLVAADVYTFRSTAPMFDSAGLTAARVALAAQQKLARSWMIIGEIATATQAGWITTAINAYQTSNNRFCLARASAADRLPLAKKSKVVGQTLTFAEVGATGDTITRSAGSWLDDGFAVGMKPVITGSLLNNITCAAGIATLTATVMTLDTDDLAAEVATVSEDVTITVPQTMAAWVAASDTAFASVDAQKRIDISLGRLRKLSPITGWSFRRPTSWAASIREYQKDIHVTTWRVEDGPLDGWSMLDANGNVAEFDERTDGGGLAGHFTTATTMDNGPNGAFISTSLTRDTESSLLSYTHNMYVANLACTVIQAATTRFIGKTVVLESNGTMRASARRKLESLVNSDLNRSLMKEFVAGEGPRASKAVWTMSPDDVLNVVDATITGSAELRVNGTIVNVNTSVRVL